MDQRRVGNLNIRTIDNNLHIWTIYFKPSDHPDGYCARKHTLLEGESKPGGELLTGSTIEQLRERFSSQGLVCIGREPEDDSVIVESWI